ncbi:MAG: hypothetical protein RMJ37_04380, partial [Spirochaetia bacterium]|nr:hypothetical protein [Spirochaetota bacterium]MDW8112564.1 hypothetical protein [Spirochaetia bacterium]
MRKFRFGFATKSAIVFALIVFLVVFVVMNYVLNIFYARFKESIRNVVDSINEGARNDIFGRMVSSINSYGDYILQNRVDEYSFFKNVIEKSLYQQSDAYSIVKTNEQGFILSCFYYDGERFYSKDSSFSEDLELTLLLRDIMKSRKITNDLFFSLGKRGFVYFYILNKGVIGAKFYPAIFNRSFLESIFGKLPFFYAVKVKGKEDKYYSDTGFVIRAMEYMPDINMDQAYSQLSSRMVNESGVEYAVFGRDVVFYIKRDYISF